MTNKWYQGIPTCQGGGRGGLHLLMSPPPTASSSLHACLSSCTSLVMCRGLWYQVPCVSMQVDVCVFTPFCWLCSAVAHFEATPFPYPPLPPFVFPFICSNERRLGSVKIHPFFCLACQLFFFLRYAATEIHSALTLQWFLKCQNR